MSANVLEPLIEIALIGQEPACIHRAAVALQRLIMSATDVVIGKQGGDVPEHAMLALGALSSLAAKSTVKPARQAAKDALAFLERDRPDIRPPPSELVAEAVSRLKAEHEKRIAEQEAAEAEMAAEKEAARLEDEARKAKKAEAAKVAKAMAAGTGSEPMPPVEEHANDDEDGDDGEVI